MLIRCMCQGIAETRGILLPPVIFTHTRERPNGHFLRCIEDFDSYSQLISFILVRVELNDQTVLAILEFRHVRDDGLTISFEFSHFP